MRLRNISIFFIVGIALINLLASCNDSETESISTTLSADAQIYSFSATYIPRTHNDTIFRKALVNAKFAIDQSSHTIYNVDSLPYGFTVKNIAASLTFSSSTPTATQVVYPNDSIIDWESASDSINFMIYPNRDASLKGVPQVEFKVTAQNGSAPYKYLIKLLIHQVDPDSIVWTQKADLPNSYAQSKALYINDEPYYYGASGSNLYAYKTSDGGVWTTVNSGTTFPANIKIESLSLLGSNLYVVDVDNNVYQSSDFGATWNTTPIASNVINILGQVYNSSSSAYGLVAIINEAGANKLALTSNFTAFTNQNTIGADFPVSEFTSIYDAKNNRQLVVGGQKEGATDYINTTWWVTFSNGSLQVISNNKPSLVPFEGTSSLVAFLYDDRLYVWAKEKSETGFKLYSSDGGMNWIEAPQKQYFHEDAEAVNGQSILVDKDGYIWSFGGNTSTSSTTKDVWRGMMRKMGFKK